MSLAAAFLMIAQTAVSGPADAPQTARSPVAVSVRATVRVLRPARVSAFGDIDGNVPIDNAPGPTPQRGRDAAGTLWIEFS